MVMRLPSLVDMLSNPRFDMVNESPLLSGGSPPA